MMITSRRLGREAALQFIYLNDVCHWNIEEVPEPVLSSDVLSPQTKEFALRLAGGVMEHRPEIDPLLTRYAENWELHRMAAMDRCILRLAAYELLHELETPVSVIIDEAVEIAKKYSTADSGKFVNGILDRIKTERPGKESPATKKRKKKTPKD